MMRIKNDNMNILFIGFLYILLLSCNWGGNSKPNLTVKQIEIDSNIEPVSIGSFYDPQKYIDSLNELKDFRNMPYFLIDSCIDGNAIYWKDLHHPISIRKKVLDNTTNIDLLKYIVNHNLYTTKCNSLSPNTLIPFYNLSLNDMVKDRLNVLLKK